MDRQEPLVATGAAFEKRRPAAGHLPFMTKTLREILHSRIDMRGGALQRIRRPALRFVPRTVNACGREFDTGPGDPEPGYLCRQRREALANARPYGAAACENER